MEEAGGTERLRRLRTVPHGTRLCALRWNLQLALRKDSFFFSF